jgi:ERCC4-type nuclease
MSNLAQDLSSFAHKISKSQLEPAHVVAIVDSREQRPLCLAPLRSQRGKLVTGDYSVRGLEHLVAIERKSIQDLIGCIGRDRERFKRELQRLHAYQYRALVVEGSWAQLERGEYRGKVSPQSAVGSLLAWAVEGLPVIMANDAEQASQFVSRMLFLAARKRWRELWSFGAATSELVLGGAK